METVWDGITAALGAVLQFVLFVIASLLFLPAFLIVTLLQDYWSKKLGELFGL